MLKIERPNQTWRAIAILENDKKVHLYIGNSIAQVRAGYANPWYNYLPLSVRKEVKEIDMQKWIGTPEKGRWLSKYSLDVLPVDIKDYVD